MPPTTRRASAAQNASATADHAQAASDGVRRAEEGRGDEGGKKRKTSSGTEAGEADEVGTRRDFFSTLPLDLFYQICGQLHPGTLLAIAQTSKLIRSTLFRKSAAPVWRAARRSAGLDALSGKLDEPTYAYLLYGKACQVCGTTKRETAADFDLQVRACAKCLETNICLASTIEDGFDDLHPLTFQCCLSTPFSYKGKRSVSRKPFYWKAEVVATSALLQEIDPVAARTDRRKARPSQAALDLKRDFDDYAGAVEADSWAFPDCVDRVEEQRLQEEKERPILRFKQIQNRLIEAGFTAEDTLATPQSVQTSPHPVTDSYWERVKNHVVRAVQEARDRRIVSERKERKERLRALYKQLLDASSPAEQEFFPNIQVFWHLPAVKAMWYPEDAVVDPSSWPISTSNVAQDLQHELRIASLRYFDQFARALLSIGVTLPADINNLITAEPSPFVDDTDESKGLAPLHDQLTNDQLFAFLRSPLAVFTCRECNRSFAMRTACVHVEQQHARSHADANLKCDARNWFQPASASYLKLLNCVVSGLGLESLTASWADLMKFRQHFQVRVRGQLLKSLDWRNLGIVCTSRQQGRTWDLVQEAVSIMYFHFEPTSADRSPLERGEGSTTTSWLVSGGIAKR